jgi:hypothetical protein
VTLQELLHTYEPYDVLAEFKEGFDAYGRGNHFNPYQGTKPKQVQILKAEAWDRGHNAGSRWKLETMKSEGAEILNFPLGGRRKR